MHVSPQRADCKDLLKLDAWFICAEVLNLEPYIQACMMDLCMLQPTDSNNSSLCATLSEYSRQCSHAGGNPPNWRTANFCGINY